MTPFTIVEPDRITSVAARLSGDQIVVPRDDIAMALGWQRKPEGLCRGEVCVPVADNAGLDVADGLDLRVLAEVLRRPLAVDMDHRAAFLGVSARDRGAQLDSLHAPDFELPDLDGKEHSLSSLRGRKVFLVAWASW